MKKILFLTSVNNTAALKDAVEKIKKEYGDIVEIRKIYFSDYENPSVSLESIEKEIESSDIVLVEVMGDVRVGRELSSMLEGKDITIVVLGGAFSLTKMGKFRGERIFKPESQKEFINIDDYIKAKKFSELIKKLGKFIPIGVLKDMRNWVIAHEYYWEGDAENLKNLILFLLKNYAEVRKIKKVSSPTHQPSYGLYIPKLGICEDFKEYKKKIGHDPTKPTIGMLLYGGLHFADTKPIADRLYEYLKNDVNFIFVFSRVEYNFEAINKYFEDIDLILNCQYFRIHGGPFGGEPEVTYNFLQKMDCPMLIGLKSYSIEIEKWRKSVEGLSPLEIVIGITLPELDGAIEPLFISGMESFDDSVIGKLKYPKILDDRIKKLASRIRNWLALRRKPNKEKRIAVITYSYPPGEENLANAGQLDVFKSLEVFLKKLKDRNYFVEIPDTPLKDLFLSSGVVNSPNYIQKEGIRLSQEKYASWFKKIPDSARNKVIEHWGNPPGDIMTDGGNILIPGIMFGNIFLGIQPTMGVHEDPVKAYHDRNLPPHHQYLAYYLFLQEDLKVDAIIHFGMHGTVEFTKGKEVALSSECFPDILIGEIPNIYYYWIGNTSESTIAKRRSYAICISHASPPMKTSELYEKYIVVEDLLNQYEYEENKDEKTLEAIKDLAEDLHLPPEPQEIRRELYKMKRRFIPYGLHILDRKPTREELVEYLLGVLRIDREIPSILKLVAKKEGFDWEEVEDTKIRDEIETQAKEIIRKILEDAEPEWLQKGYGAFVRNIVENTQKSSESENLLRALEGKYIFPARGGDPIRDPEVYPSGRSMYAFDPRLIPTVAAEVRGRKSADLLVDSYLKKHGRYPESVGIVLWGFETLNTGGDTIATILSLIGARIKHRKSPWFKELEIIPLEELKRPRIDVMITICGIFRDTLGTHIDLINKAIEMIAGLDESSEKNYIKKHFLQGRERLKDSALARIFGPSPTEYATSMRTLVESSVWKDEKDLVKSYDDSMSYAYLRERIEKNEDALFNALKSIDIVTQERNTTEYEITDLDHYYEFLGGLARSVQDKKGEKAEILVTDSTEEDVVVEDLKIAIERATRTRLLNPLWIEGMLKHEFHGTKKIKDKVEHLLAFAATTGKVENWVFDEVVDKLVFNEEIREKLKENNPYATMKLAELLLESERRGYWKVEEEKLKQLQDLILKMEGDIE